MPKQELKLYYWDDLDLVEPEHAFALVVSKEHAIELIVEDFYDGLSGGVVNKRRCWRSSTRSTRYARRSS